jgi:hypothetical protein
VLTQGIAATSGAERYGSRCAACHGDAHGSDLPPALEPPDAIAGASLSLSRFERQNPRLPLAPPKLDASDRIEVDFSRDVQPILERRCVKCHGDHAPAAAVTLTATPTKHFTQAYENLLRPGAGSGSGRAFVDDGDCTARTSRLIELLTGEHAALTDDELLTLARWIELCATFRGSVSEEREP